MNCEKHHVMNVIQSFFLAQMSFTVEDHNDLRKHMHIDHNMIFYEERKTSCDECHSELKTTTT